MPPRLIAGELHDTRKQGSRHRLWNVPQNTVCWRQQTLDIATDTRRKEGRFHTCLLSDLTPTQTFSLRCVKPHIAPEIMLEKPLDGHAIDLWAGEISWACL